jgi:uncharacterized membrane protein
MGFFADAMFAAAMTLLVIEIPRPPMASRKLRPSTATAVPGCSAHFCAYALAFLMFWIVAVQLLDHGVVLRGEDHIPTVRLAFIAVQVVFYGHLELLPSPWPLSCVVV